MERTLFALLIFLAAFFGGVITAVLGWLDTSDKFNIRKFMTSVIKSFIGAAVIAVGFDYSGTTSVILILVAFLAGAGVDAGIKRLTNLIKK